VLAWRISYGDGRTYAYVLADSATAARDVVREIDPLAPPTSRMLVDRLPSLDGERITPTHLMVIGRLEAICTACGEPIDRQLIQDARGFPYCSHVCRNADIDIPEVDSRGIVIVLDDIF
jgi:hypothetical protein